ncbi:MAG TPA: carboxypeptidase regulatory-like domain-containing protein [Saprospiraceae bacterium]|nr:carboxypeptidase regulatory-like domain-containing protein [Saprospiraceae bacterium]HMQ85036.1 carboxypeptidase regulatory-like domain-containing protein [Saprospiraceae bacterium]
MKLFKTILGFAIFLSFYLPLSAQVTTATLSGIVVDESNNPLDGANVVAVHEPSGSQYGTTTREDGRFTLPNLRVGGPYKVTASYVGYQDGGVGDITLALAQKLNVSITLESGALELDEIIVKSKANEVLNSERTGAELNVSSELIQRLPTISRSASDYYRLTPASDGNSFGGRNDQFNNFSLDGTIFNNPFGLDAATPGGQTDAQPISLDAIDQIQVSLAPYDVTQSGFTGAAINAVTKSGTNDWHGTVFGFYRNQDMTGSKVSGTDIFVPDLSQIQTGFSLGGPLKKDKLFLFINAEIERREDLGSNFIAAGQGRSGENVSRVAADDLERVSDALFNRYGYETGPYENYLHDTDNEKGIVKLDWVINKNHSFTATYNFLNASKQKPAHPSAIGRRGPDAVTLQFFNSGYQINNVIHSGIVELRSLFGNKASNKLQLGYSAFRDSRDPFSTPFPVVNISNNDGIRYIVAGHEPFSINNRLDQDVFQITDNFNIYAGNHTFTIGASLERFDFNNSFNLNAYGGTFGPGFASVDAFLDTLASGAFDDDVQLAKDVFDANGGDDGVEGEGWALAETNVGQAALYFQDEWAMTNRFTLTLGIRADMPLYFDTEDKLQENIDRNCCYIPDIVWYDENGDPVQFNHLDLPEQTPLISPRLGFNWDINGDQTAQLRGGTGLFSGRLPFVWIGNQVANPNFFFYNKTANDFKFPQVWRSNLGYDRQFGGGWIASLDLIYTKDINAAMVRNYSLRPPTARLGGVDDERLIYAITDRAFLGTDPLFGTGYVFTNTNLGYTFNASLQLQRDWTNGWYTSLAYNYLDAQDVSSIEAEISSDAFDRNPAINNVNDPILAPSIYGNRHRIVGAAHKKFTYGNMATTLAVFFQYAQGGRFSYTYSGDINNDFSGLNDLIYIPTDGEIDQMLFTGNADEQAAQRTALRNYIKQDDYLSENQGAFAEKYALLSPWYSNWDVRVLQDLNFGKNTIQLSVDVLNFGNLISSNWGVRQLPTNTQPIGVSLSPDNIPTYSFDTSLTSTFRDDFSLLSRWQLQVGLRYIF